MTAHELAKKLLEGPDVDVVYDDQRYGDLFVVNTIETTYDDDDKLSVIRLGW